MPREYWCNGGKSARTLNFYEQRLSTVDHIKSIRFGCATVPATVVDLFLSVPVAQREIGEARLVRASRSDVVRNVQIIGAETGYGSVGETHADLNRVLLHLVVEGALSLQDRQYFEESIIEGVSAAFCFLRVDDYRLFPCPTPEDLDQIDRGGFVRAAAEKLMQLAQEGGDSERSTAAEALQRLYIEHMKLQVEQR